MRPFDFIQAQNEQAAFEAVAVGSSRLIAGGTNLLDLMKFGVEAPSRIIDINALRLRGIETQADGSVFVGALVRNSDLACHSEIAKRYPVLSEALLSGASPQLRNMATLGGNLMQRTRCPYFYDVAFACNKRKPGSGCSAIAGFNRGHAVLGTSEKCIATHPSDMCVAMAALDAAIHVAGPDKKRDIRFHEFHKLPGDTPEIETELQPGELILGVTLPPLEFARRSHYLKVRDRASYEFALASAAVALDIRDGKIQSARIALGGVGAKPWRSLDAEDALAGKAPNDAAFHLAADAAVKFAKAQTHNGFKIELAKRTLVRALAHVAGDAA